MAAPSDVFCSVILMKRAGDSSRVSVNRLPSVCQRKSEFNQQDVISPTSPFQATFLPPLLPHHSFSNSSLCVSVAKARVILKSNMPPHHFWVISGGIHAAPKLLGRLCVLFEPWKRLHTDRPAPLETPKNENCGHEKNNFWLPSFFFFFF